MAEELKNLVNKDRIELYDENMKNYIAKLLKKKANWIEYHQVDFNTVTTPGLYTMDQCGINAPNGGADGYYSLIVCTSTTNSQNYVHQIAIPELSTDIYIRVRNDSSWGDWEKLPSSLEVDNKQDKLTYEYIDNKNTNWVWGDPLTLVTADRTAEGDIVGIIETECSFNLPEELTSDATYNLLSSLTVPGNPTSATVGIDLEIPCLIAGNGDGNFAYISNANMDNVSTTDLYVEDPSKLTFEPYGGCEALTDIIDLASEGGAAITVDTALSSTSTNPVQNKVVNTAINNRAPKSHAASSTTYGVGTANNYGHVKLSDSVTSTSAASSGYTAATPAAVKSAYDLANTKKNSATIVIGLNGTHSTSEVDYLANTSNANPIILEAVNALPTNGGKIIFREGTYTISDEAITCNKNIVFEGMGEGNTILNSNYDAPFLKYGAYNITVKNLTFNASGMEANSIFESTSSSANVLNLENCKFTSTVNPVDSSNNEPTILVSGSSSASNRVKLKNITLTGTFKDTDNVGQCGAVFRYCKISGGEGCFFTINRTAAPYNVNVFYACVGKFSGGSITGTQFVWSGYTNLSISDCYISCQNTSQANTSNYGSFVNNRLIILSPTSGYFSFATISNNQIYKNASGSVLCRCQVFSNNSIFNNSRANDFNLPSTTDAMVTGNISKYQLSSTYTNGIQNNRVYSSLVLNLAQEG